MYCLYYSALSRACKESHDELENMIGIVELLNQRKLLHRLCVARQYKKKRQWSGYTRIVNYCIKNLSNADNFLFYNTPPALMAVGDGWVHKCRVRGQTAFSLCSVSSLELSLASQTIIYLTPATGKRSQRDSVRPAVQNASYPPPQLIGVYDNPSCPCNPETEDASCHSQCHFRLWHLNNVCVLAN